MKIKVLYDETCVLCQMSKKRVIALDWFTRVHWVSLQEYEESIGYPAYKRKELRKEIHLITSKGTVLKGFYAVRKIMLQCPILVIPGVICYFPFIDVAGNCVYRWVAKNRHLFFRTKCDDNHCSF